jgi:iron complex outermembrane receptor protein
VGSFTLTVAPGDHRVTVPYIAHQTGVEFVSVAAGGTATLEIELIPVAVLLEGVVTSVDRGLSARNVISVPAAVGVTRGEQIQVQAATTIAGYMNEHLGVDDQQTGIAQRNMVIRGFNNVFSSSLLVLTDNRYARVPSLRLNAYNMIPVPPLDVDRIEVVLGPASALYGPNSANGVMHIITTSPIDAPGTSVSVTGGNRSLFSGAFRQAIRFNEKAGLKVSGQYFKAADFKFRDPAEVATPSNPLIANRVFDSERYGGEARFDYRPWQGSDDGVTLAYGLNQLVNSIELTGIGAAQAQDWRYQYGQVQFKRSGLFAQAFLNASDAGDTYLLRTGQSIVDKSTVLATQAQYAFSPVEIVDLVVGVDFSKTTPKTEGTILGANEDVDGTIEYGGYVSSTLGLSKRLDLVGALRMDDHEHLSDPVWSPRVGLVFEPAEGQAFRTTYNRAPARLQAPTNLSAASRSLARVSSESFRPHAFRASRYGSSKCWTCCRVNSHPSEPSRSGVTSLIFSATRSAT